MKLRGGMICLQIIPPREIHLLPNLLAFHLQSFSQTLCPK